MMSQITDIHIESYDELANGANEMLSTMKTMNDDIESSDKYIKDVLGDTAFKGPMADAMSNLWNQVDGVTIKNISILGYNANTLSKMTDNYVNADDKSSKDIGGIM